MRRAAHPWDRFYRDHEAPWRGERSLAALRPWLGDGRVLELGCGNGKLLRPLRRAGVDAIGLDVSFHALHRLGGGVLADAAWLPFADGAFATVLDIHCTGHLRAGGRAAAAAHKHRVLRSGGMLVVERLAPDDLRAGGGEEVEPGTRRLADGRTTRFSTADDITAEHPGFGVVDVHDELRHTRYRGEAVRRHAVRVVLQKAA